MHAWLLPWTFFSGRLPIFSSLSSFFFFSPLQLVLLRFNLVPSSGACSSGISFCLSCCLYFYASGMWVVFLNVGEMALYRRCPVHSSSAHPSCRPSCMLWGLPPWGLCGSFCCGGLCGRFDRLGWPWSVYLPGTSLYNVWESLEEILLLKPQDGCKPRLWIYTVCIPTLVPPSVWPWASYGLFFPVSEDNNSASLVRGSKHLIDSSYYYNSPG